MNPTHLAKQSLKGAHFLKFLANPVRLRILCLLFEAPCTVTHLHTTLRLSQPLISQHLALLRRHKLVTSTRQGQTAVYKLQHPLITPLLQLLHNHFCPPPSQN